MNILKIKIHLHEKEDLYHPFNDSTLNPMLANYIYDECLGFPKNSQISLQIKTDFPIEPEEVKKLIHNYFKQELKEKEVLKKHSFVFHSIILLFGFICIFLSYSAYFNFFHEIFLILGWLSIWEIAYDILFINGKDRVKNARYQKLSKVKIDFQ